jgi:hypothetical protein
MRHVDEPFDCESFDLEAVRLRAHGRGALDRLRSKAHVESLKAEWHFRVIYERNHTLSKEMSFLTPATQGARVCLFLSMPSTWGLTGSR